MVLERLLRPVPPGSRWRLPWLLLATIALVNSAWHSLQMHGIGAVVMRIGTALFAVGWLREIAVEVRARQKRAG